ncbi:MazG nucleotide pyrophosphohydrolase domain-containing protein [Arthrobacter agilis]|uniref:MazG nucleotide pyrophosphohydrolase domain-containing protein n=1 Tax=Arthrobacter agilis TaxID=37921 RepID=UPI002365E1EC|nr:MazG nucleotide pyrophosphohydrolase domain-containing protein [Arthrobacter agilis]WDF34182.1 MazG nucleotide pyrophosphohydrolase domain-containing protein [Arthrobacter agilis]
MTPSAGPTPAAAGGRTPGAAVDRLVEVVGLLRRHCPWTAALTHEALLRYLVEETYELYEAVDDVVRADDPPPALLEELQGELGDVLYQVVLHAQLASESSAFGLADVAGGLTAKLVRRNPHVFAPDGSSVVEAGGPPASLDEIVETWHAVKRREKPARRSPFDGIPRHLPALALAATTLQRAGAPLAGVADGAADGTAAGTEDGTEDGTGGDVPARRDPEDGHIGAAPMAEARIGRALLELTRQSLLAGVDPERALRRAVLEFQEQDAAGDESAGTHRAG